MFSGAIPQHPVSTTGQSFSTLGLSEPILDIVTKIGFEHPTAIQAAVIPLALEGRDVIGLAQTGSGKTAAFCLPVAERLTHGRGVRGLILSPTREIALQTKAFLDVFGVNHELNTACVIGGVKMHPQTEALRREPDIIVATPGRLLDHVRQRHVKLDAIEELVLDEADHMLDLGFLPQMREILRLLSRQRRTMMFSATMPDSIEMIAKEFMRDPVRI
ncbi:MAG: DEAD/DEAH box helicase, partial [Thermoanaerobaculia bacterium]